MTKTEQNRVLAWRLKVLREASATPRNVAQTCRHFGLSRKAFYKWKARYEAQGEAGLCDRPRTPHRSPRATPREVVSKILYLRQHYHFGPGRIADYLQRFHQLQLARSSVHRIHRCRPQLARSRLPRRWITKHAVTASPIAIPRQ